MEKNDDRTERISIRRKRKLIELNLETLSKLE